MPVIGATDRLGGEIVERGVHFGEVFATLYHQLGIDTSHITLPDLSGRPQYLVDAWHEPPAQQRRLSSRRVSPRERKSRANDFRRSATLSPSKPVEKLALRS
ncbi:MAG: DUF1501 domain-containing protein [Verrucomicrobia bacterium]|nr:DUF1501 domain-containing protein [Verrucomicrobiota bacterium]